ncbi:MAG: iron ABC transporter permease, partial [Bacteroidales bacterium]|nr:iron ABC transporter permease [Bacteroidales bacterium]
MQREITKTYKKYIRSKNRFIAGTLVLTLVLIVLGISMGAAKISFTESIRAIWGLSDEVNRQIILNIRLPRVLAAIFCGMALSVSGAAMQSILRNPLGSPFTLGISNAAAFGAAFAVIVFGAGSMQSSATDSVLYNNPYIITISAFFWSLVS